MDRDLLHRLTEAGALASLSDGAPAVRVSLQYTPVLHERSRRERREHLLGCFERVAATIAPMGAEVDLASLSVLAQTVEAILPVEKYDDIVSKLQSCEVRVDPVIERHVTAAK